MCVYIVFCLICCIGTSALRKRNQLTKIKSNTDSACFSDMMQMSGPTFFNSSSKFWVLLKTLLAFKTKQRGKEGGCFFEVISKSLSFEGEKTAGDMWTNQPELMLSSLSLSNDSSALELAEHDTFPIVQYWGVSFAPHHLVSQNTKAIVHWDIVSHVLHYRGW